MNQSTLSFASPDFRMNTDQSNPEDPTLSEQKLPKNPLSTHQTQLTFNKIHKRFLFAEDQSDSDQQAQNQEQRQTFSKRQPYSGKKNLFNKHSQNDSFSPSLMKLLENCKASIQTLQQELEQKNLFIKKLEDQKYSLSKKLTESQKQVQRIQQILNIYIKESKEKDLNENDPLNSIKNNVQNELKSQIQQLSRINDTCMQQNEHLKNVNAGLQNEVTQLHSENYILNQKIHKVGKGVGKALSTIKKNNQSSDKITEFILLSQQKSPLKLRQHGKIATYSQQQPTKPSQNPSFQTPIKTNPQNAIPSSQKQTESSFYQASQQKLADISRKAKRLDQLQKLEQMLSKMQKLAENDNQSSHNSSH